jgi:hypothetical protein
MSDHNPTIAERGAIRAQNLALATQGEFRTIMALIETEIEANDGVYPFNNGRVTADELIKRANKSKAILQKPQHKSFKMKEVDPFLKRCVDRAGRRRADVRKTVNELARQEGVKLRAMQNKFALRECEYDNANRKRAKAEAEAKKISIENELLQSRLRECERRIAELTIQLSGSNIVRLTQHDQTRHPDSKCEPFSHDKISD